jgi:hypothetical protein
MARYPKRFQIFEAGTFTSVSGGTFSFSEGDILGMATAYDPERRPAPLVLGHPESDFPAFGEVHCLVQKSGKLYAQASVHESLIGMVRQKLYRTVSASFLEPGAPGNPSSRAYYLKHVGFLGAHPPAVKGMDPLSFSEGNCSAKPALLPIQVTADFCEQSAPFSGDERAESERLALAFIWSNRSDL